MATSLEILKKNFRSIIYTQNAFILCKNCKNCTWFVFCLRRKIGCHGNLPWGIGKTGPDRENSRKCLSFGGKIVKIGLVDTEIVLLKVKKNKKRKKKLTQAKYIALPASLPSGLNKLPLLVASCYLQVRCPHRQHCNWKWLMQTIDYSYTCCRVYVSVRICVSYTSEWALQKRLNLSRIWDAMQFGGVWDRLLIRPRPTWAHVLMLSGVQMGATWRLWRLNDLYCRYIRATIKPIVSTFTGCT